MSMIPSKDLPNPVGADVVALSLPPRTLITVSYPGLLTREATEGSGGIFEVVVSTVPVVGLLVGGGRGSTVVEFPTDSEKR